MRSLFSVLAVLLLAACSPGPQSMPASSEAFSAIAPSPDPGLKPAIPANSAAMEEAVSPSPAQCRAEIGETAAQNLADRCRMVSPATHPPCNVANSCQMIQDEIDRSCAMWDKDTTQSKPKECTA